MEINRIYSLERTPDRRKQDVFVAVNRRSGHDRRKNPRLFVASKFRQEILDNPGEKIPLPRIYNLNYAQDRRQQNIPVKLDQRSNNDRRQNPRLTVDPKIKHDIASFKSKLPGQIQTDKFEKSPISTRINTNSTQTIAAGINAITLIKPIFNAAKKLTKTTIQNTAIRPGWGSYIKSVLSILSMTTVDIQSFLNPTDKKQTSKAIVTTASRLAGCVASASLVYFAFPKSINNLPILLPGVIGGIVGTILGNEAAKHINKKV